MKFEEYLESCGDVGEDFWDSWVGKNHTALTIALKTDYKGQTEKYSWTQEYCKGRVLFFGSWVLFEFEEDSVLYALRWI